MSPYNPLPEPSVADLYAIEHLPWQVSQERIERRLADEAIA